MFVPFLIMLREGLEAALIVGIVAGYLVRTGRRAWLPYVWSGIALAAATSLIAAAGLQWASAEFPQRAQELFEAVVGAVAVVVLTSMVFWLRGAARSMSQTLRGAVDQALDAGAARAGWTLVGMVFFAVAREGLESVFFLLATVQQTQGPHALLGGLAGLAVAAVLGLGIYAGGLRLDLARFFRWTGVFILVVAAGMLAGTVRALHEAGIWNAWQTVLFDLSGSFPADGPIGTVFAGLLGYNDAPTLSEGVAYVVFLAVSLTAFFLPARGSAPPPRAVPAVGPGAKLFRPGGRSAVAALTVSLAVLASSVAMLHLSTQRPSTAAPDAWRIVLDGHACQPGDLTLPAGRHTFVVDNRSGRAVEWEILQGVMVVDERENIAPGFTQSLTTTLAPGQYEMTCGLLSNPRGRLVVTESDASRQAQARRPSLTDFVGPLAQYRVYLMGQARSLQAASTALAAAVRARDVPAARNAYRQAYDGYARIEPVAGGYADLAARLDGRAAYFERGERDPAFMGFRRVGAWLARPEGAWGDEAARLAAALDADVRALVQRLDDDLVPPDRMIAGAVRALEQAAADLPATSVVSASSDDDPILAHAQAIAQGARAVFDTFEPMVARRAPARAQAVESAFERWREAPADRDVYVALAGELSGTTKVLGYE